jgi:hypothetical protein
MNQTDHLYRWLITVAVVFAITRLFLYWSLERPHRPGSTCERLMTKYKDPPAYLKIRCKEKS